MIDVDNNGLVTATVTQTAGYVTATTDETTYQLPVQVAKTYTPGTSNQVIAAGKYLSGAQTIKGDVNLVAENIKSGVSIFGVNGTAASTVIDGTKATGYTFSYSVTNTSTYGFA